MDPGTIQAHARWLHDLRSAVSTAGVATAVGRALVDRDAAGARDALREAEHALGRCRELLAAEAVVPMPSAWPTTGRASPVAVRATSRRSTRARLP